MTVYILTTRQLATWMRFALSSYEATSVKIANSATLTTASLIRFKKMLVSSQISRVSTVESLVNIWTTRYFPDTSIVSINDNSLIRAKLHEASLENGRNRTAEKLPRRLIEKQCNLAAVRARELYSYYDPSTFKETAHLAKLISRIYLKLLEVYSGLSPIVLASRGIRSEAFENISLEAWGIPKINKLADALKPLLVELQNQFSLTQKWRSLGFITTQVTLSNVLLLEHVTPAEKVLLNTYFKFFEEQVSLPLQRVCSAAAKHSQNSPTFKTVERMLPLITEISVATHDRWSKAFPNYNSRRGRLNDPAVKHSSVRDFDMFQVYLWLCFLEGSLTFVEQELVAVCIIVFDALNIPWSMTVEGTTFLMDEMLKRLQPNERELISPYTRGMIKAFSNR